MSDEKRGLLEAIRLGKEIKESVPSGSEYKNTKAAVQFYRGVLKDLERREAEARRRLDELKAQPFPYEIRETEIVIPFGDDVQELLQGIDSLREFLTAAWSMTAAQKGKLQVRELMEWEQNHANKIGIDEVRKRLLENDMLTAAALQERG